MIFSIILFFTFTFQFIIASGDSRKFIAGGGSKYSSKQIDRAITFAQRRNGGAHRNFVYTGTGSIHPEQERLKKVLAERQAKKEKQ